MRVTTALCLFFVAVSSFGLNNRSAVSVSGSDLNPCTTALPCRSFLAALTQTNFAGEVIALDSAGYGPFYIDRSVFVGGAPGIHAAITVTSGIAIDINAAASDRVTLRNLVLLGGGGNIGINVGTLGFLTLDDVSISAFTVDGIFALGNVNVTVDHCRISDNFAAIGIDLLGARAVINNSQLNGNAYGVKAEENGAALVSHCLLAWNSNAGISVIGFGGGTTSTVFVEDCEIVANNTWGVLASNNAGTGTALVRLSNNVIFGNSTGVEIGTGGTVYSYGNNKINGNASDLGGAPLTGITQR